jgi:hypothetical protein
MSADSFVVPMLGTQGVNRYAYVGNQPLTYTDPTGFSPASGGNWDDWPPLPPLPDPCIFFCNPGYLGDGHYGGRVDQPGWLLVDGDVSNNPQNGGFFEWARVASSCTPNHIDVTTPNLQQPASTAGGGVNGYGGYLLWHLKRVTGVLWWNSSREVTTYGYTTNLWMGDDQFAPRTSMVSNGDFVKGGVRAASLIPFPISAETVPASAMTTLYRAVGEAEALSVRATGRFLAGPNSLGGKWFAETLEHAKQWGDLLNGKGASRILEVKLPKSVADQLMRMERLDNIGPARYGELDELEQAVIRELP